MKSAVRAVQRAAKPPVASAAPRRRAAQPVLGIQRKPLIGPVDDPLEREADRVAEAVAAGGLATAIAPAPPQRAQRTCAACEEAERESGEMCQECAGTIRRQAEQEEPEEEDELRLKASGPPVAGAAGAAARAVSSGGRPLSAEQRAYFEPRFGTSLADVRVHTDMRAAAAARAIKAHAYTLGRDIAFAPSQFAPERAAGRRLIAHELAHVVQQRSGGGPSPSTIRRQNGAGAAPPAPRQNYGGTCSGGATDPCQYDRCGDRHGTIIVDLSRAIGYIEGAIQALGAMPLAGGTARLLDWYFNDTSSETATIVHRRLACIRDCLQNSLNNDQYGCNPDYPDASKYAYVCVGSTPPCSEVTTPICLTNTYFGLSPKQRAEGAIHECAHRVGMSLGGPASAEDIYRHTRRFMFLDTSEALLNSDSYAMFAGAVSGGVPISISMPVSLSGGVAIPERGEATWQARLYGGLEFQHPVLGIFNPTLGLGISLIGETTTGGPAPATADMSLLYSLLAGVRIADPRPGGAGGGYASFFGGPALVLGGGGERIGAEAGVALGYRWRWLDVSAGVGYTYDPTREAGMKDLLTLSASVTFLPVQSTRH